MPIEVPDTRGRGAPPPRRRAPRKADSAVVAEPEAAEASQPIPEPPAEPPPLESQPAEPAAVAPAAASGRSVFGKAGPRRRVTRPAEPAPAPAPEPPAERAPDPPGEAAVPATPPQATPPQVAVPEPEPAPAVPDPAPAAPTAHDGSPEPAAAPVEPVELSTVVVRLGGTRYALPMDAIAEVGRPPRVTRVPGLPPWVAGVVNWRGRVLAVLDLRPLLATPQTPLPVTGRVAVLNSGGISIGLLTERVDGVVPVDVSRLEPAPTTLPPAAAALVAGAVTEPAGPVVLLDLDSVFDLRHKLPRPRRAG